MGARPDEAIFDAAISNELLDVNLPNRSTNLDLQQRGTSINAREFSDKAYFGDGAPQIIE